MESGMPETRSDRTLEEWQKMPPLSWAKALLVVFVFICVCLAVFFFALAFSSSKSPLIVDMALLALLGALVLFDARSKVLPDIFTFSLIVFGVVWNFLQHNEVLMPVVGAFIGYTVFYAISAIWKSRTGDTGLGLGDAKLLAGGGALLGPFYLPYIVLLSSGLALMSVFFTLPLRQSKERVTIIAFGPYICLAVWTFWKFNILP